MMVVFFGLQTWKDVAQVVLIQSGASSSLESGLKLLCNSEVYVSAVCDAVRHASQTVCLLTLGYWKLDAL